MQLKCYICQEEIRGESIIDHYKEEHPAAYTRYLKANQTARRRKGELDEEDTKTRL